MDACQLGARLRRRSFFYGFTCPPTPYEQHGDVGNVVFPCGVTIAPDGDTIHLYYGAADTSIGLATGSVRAMLEWLECDS